MGADVPVRWRRVGSESVSGLTKAISSPRLPKTTWKSERCRGSVVGGRFFYLYLDSARPLIAVGQVDSDISSVFLLQDLFFIGESSRNFHEQCLRAKC